MHGAFAPPETRHEALIPAPRLRRRQDSPPERAPLTVSFVSQKGGVGKSTLARLFAVGAAHRGLKPLLADFDLEQLTCVEWNAIRLQNAVEPDIDARAFKSLKKLRKIEDRAGVVVVDTRGLADELAHEIAEDSDVVFLPTGASRRRFASDAGARAKARQARRRGAARRRAVEDRPLGAAVAARGRAIETAGFELLPEHWPQRDGFQSDLDSGRAGREARNPYLREAAEKMEAALFARVERAKPR